MKQQHAVPRKHLLATALLLAMTSPVMAQDATATQDPKAATATQEDAKDLDTVVVVGIRGALESAMNLKRDSQGVVDGISSEDIGKFPDTNLAESLQRISGVSIDRTASGEGSKVTVRGIGPDYNLVLLNGRQMPAAGNANGAGVSNSRAFDFANLASESISEVEVYKTSRAANPAGGIGATLNIKTARPLEAGNLANIGVKGVYDTSNGNLPKSMQGNDLTGEVSGIFSRTFADGKFGISLTGSYQDRDSGLQPGRGGQWLARSVPRRREQLGHHPAAAPGSPNVTNHPDPDRRLFGAAEPELQRQRHPAPAHQRPADPAVGADRSPDRDARLHLLREQDPAAAQRDVGVVQLRSVGELVDRRPGGRPDHLFGTDPGGQQRPGDGRRASWPTSARTSRSASTSSGK